MLKIFQFIFVLIALGECQCPVGYTYIKSGCFRAHNYITASWDDAQEFCSFDQNGYLAIIDSCSLLGDLAVYFHINGNKSTVGYWIGATDKAQEGFWKWTDGTDVILGVPFWASVQNGSSATWFLEPSGGMNENCALLSPSDQYFFRDEDCRISANPLCQTNSTNDTEQRPHIHNHKRGDTEDTFCTDDFHYVDGQCFYFETDVYNILSWEDAREYCQTNKSAKLAVLNDCDLFGSLVKLIEANYPLDYSQSYWIGASDNGDEGAWYWLDYTPVRLGLPFWGQYNKVNQPDANLQTNCIDMYRNDFYYFHDADCMYRTRFICQRDPGLKL